MISKVAFFALGSKVFALPVEGILQIVSEARFFTLPLLRPGIQGLFLCQHRAIPLLERRLVAGGGQEVGCDESSTGCFAIVYSTDLGPIGLPADKILGLVDRDRGREEEVAEEKDGGRVTGRVFVCSGDRYPLLEVEGLVASLPQ